MGSRELAEWSVYFELEPFGPLAVNLNFARLLSLLYDINKSKESTDMGVKDWMLGEPLEEETQRQSIDDMDKLLRQLITPAGKKRKKKKKETE